VLRLEKVFAISVRWDAVLLIDEADVVLEKRSYENMNRNAVVSGEYISNRLPLPRSPDG
jgi:hypothetical protein